MNIARLLFLCLTVFGVVVTYCAAQMKSTERCSCLKKQLRRVHVRRMQAIEVFSASPWCSKIEIIATVKRTGVKLCIDPDGMQGRTLLENQGTRKRKKNTKKRRGKKQR
ncbi:hypothetical protein JZ751_001848 [Albula glossodonta]|uniref:Chemokine interleukin-8-like domain-containing protein n=1 Tax=Albula glossodonta TaxID=121402 RepID=A0A8T2PUY9_9TELE|nr:hypothetical protein JZ751_001848 [Albula glossodonta]